MRKRLSAAARWAGRLLGVLLLAATLGYAALRSGAVTVEPARALLEQALAGALNRRVSIGSLELRWHGLAPSILARDVAISTPEARDRILELPEVRLRLHFWESLRSARPAVRSLAVEGAVVEAERLQDGRILVHGLTGPHPHDVLRLLGRLLGEADVRLELTDTRLAWIDRVQHVRYRFSGVQVTAVRRAGHYRIGLRVGLPEELGRTLRVTTTLSGDLEDPRTWHGRAYLRLTGALLAQGERWVALGIDPDSRPLLDAELWVRWTGRGVDRISGTVALEDLRIDPSRLIDGITPGPLQLDRLAARGIWQRTTDGWAAHLERTHIVVGGELLADTDVTLFARHEPGRGTRYELLAGAIEVGPLAGLLQRLPQVRPHLDATHNLDAGGRITELYAVIPSGPDADYALSGRFQDAHLFGLAAVPGLYGLDGEFSFDRSGGEVALYSDDLFVTHPALAATPWQLGRIRALLRWSSADGGWQVDLPVLSLSNADLRVEAVGWLRMARGESPYLVLDAALHDADLAALKRYLPTRGIHPAVRSWLERSILGGRVEAGSLNLRGPLDRFPFADGEGEFRASARIRGGVLRPTPLSLAVTDIDGRLEWYRASLSGRATRFRSDGLEGHGAAMFIPDLRDAVLRLNLTGAGPIRKLQAILSDVLRVTRRPDWTRRLVAQGHAGFGLTLRLPLGGDARQRTRPQIHGRVTLGGVALRVAGMESGIDSIRGAVRFAEDTIAGTDLTARLNGVPMRVRLSSEARGVRLALETHAPAATLWPDLPEWLAKRLEGGTAWKGVLHVPTHGQTGLRLRLESDLQGLSVDLPGGLGKPRNQSVALKVEAEFAGVQHRRLWVDYGGRAALAAVLAREGPGWRMERGELRFGAHRAVLPAHGWRVRGRLPELAPRRWTSLGPSTDENAGLPGTLDVDLRVGRLRLGPDMHADDLRLRARGTARRWRVRLDSEALAGTLELPRKAARFVPVEVNLEHVLWRRLRDPGPGGKRPRAAPIGDPDPRDLPAIKLHANHVDLGEGRRLEDLRAAFTPTDAGLRLQRLVFHGPGLRGAASGTWERGTDGRSRLRLQARFESDDVGEALRGLRLDEGFRGGSGRLELQLRWTGPPWGPRLDTLRGQGVIHLEKGWIGNLEPGVGRVLGLINPAALPRRVTLDFRDLLEKGYRYDRIEGAFTLTGLELRLRGVEVVGPAAELVINGSERLDARRHDLVVDVTPQLGLGPAIAGTVLGGPVVGAAVFVAERLLKKGGADISRVARVTYRVRGDWDDPHIARQETADGATAAGGPEALGPELLGAD